MLPVPRFSRAIGLVLNRRCGKNLVVAGCGFLGWFLPSHCALWASFWSDTKCKSDMATVCDMKVATVAGVVL